MGYHWFMLGKLVGINHSSWGKLNQLTYNWGIIILGKLSYVTDLNSSAIKWDDFPYKNHIYIGDCFGGPHLFLDVPSIED